MKLNDYLKQIEERAAKATEGPWEPIYNGNSLLSIASTSKKKCIAQSVHVGPSGKHPLPGETIRFFPQAGSQEAKEFDFIAHARQDVPTLCKLLRAAIRELSQGSRIAFEAEAKEILGGEGE